jgi:hypothetical protein
MSRLQNFRKANDLIDGSPMAAQKRACNPKRFLTTVGTGRKMVFISKGAHNLPLGDAADALFVIQKDWCNSALSPKLEGRQPSTYSVMRWPFR